MTNVRETILIKRYASRRLYNTQTSDYVTLEEVARFIRDGSDIQIIDRKTGDDLTRQYLLQIITDYETRGENVLPINILMDLVRSYENQAHSVIPEFLSQSFEMLKQQQQDVLNSFQENMPGAIPPLALPVDGLEEWQKLQSTFLNQMMGAWSQNNAQDNQEEDQPVPPKKQSTKRKPVKNKETTKDDEIDDIKQQLSQLQEKLKDL